MIVAITRGDLRVSRSQTLDDLAGAAFAMAVAILGVAGVIIVLSSFYGTDALIVDPGGGPEWTAHLYESLLDSTIGGSIARELVPLLGAVLVPILPPDVREVMG
jgi:hypothetical protein